MSNTQSAIDIWAILDSFRSIMNIRTAMGERISWPTLYSKSITFLVRQPEDYIIEPINKFQKVLVANELYKLLTTDNCDYELLEFILCNPPIKNQNFIN